ncbi:tektin-1 [Condylostylus longicornis]|uniref:tektin-1 n=1 Tax=Condylostylus longicornis TaxID=2530218 RepID=UPI00244E09E0|nr:tektin-1 [Condylostylus longicornis]
MGMDNECHTEIISRAPPKYSDSDWEFNNRSKFEMSENQQRNAERVLEESRRMVDEVRDTTETWKREVDHSLHERTTEIKYLVDELNQQKRTGLEEEDALKTYRNRLLRTLQTCRETSLAICQKCIIFREGRLGTDLCDDEADRQLRQELRTINGCQALLEKTLNQTNEQIRRLKATLYLLDRDLSAKDKSLRIDETNLSLRENQQQLSVFHGKSPLEKCAYTLPQWQHQTYKNIENTAKELNSAAELRAYIDLVIKQVIEDLENQRDRTNEAFERRIAETRRIKEDLENTHSDTLKHIMEIQSNIQRLEKEISDKEGYLALCQMRLGNRAQRPGLEMTRDNVQESLFSELQALKATLGRLNNKLLENKATLRYLLQAQVMQEEEINIKTNTLKIDDVNCMTLRRNLLYRQI